MRIPATDFFTLFKMICQLGRNVAACGLLVSTSKQALGHQLNHSGLSLSYCFESQKWYA